MSDIFWTRTAKLFGRTFKVHEHEALLEGGELPHCPRCHQTSNMHALAFHTQMGFVIDVSLAFVECYSCGSEFAMRWCTPSQMVEAHRDALALAKEARHAAQQKND
jgi:transcription elongation factor Elf1